MTISNKMINDIPEPSKKSNDKLGTLEQEALKRKERLKELKRKAESKQITENDEETEPKKLIPTPKFRNYQPESDEIKEHVIGNAPVGDVAAEVEEQLAMLSTPLIIDEIDIVNLAPRKPDWDLKRDVSKRLETLDRRTQRAIAELIRERLRENQDNLLEAVNVASSRQLQYNNN